MSEEHTHILEDGTVITHCHDHGHTHDPKEVRAIVNRLAKAVGHLESVKHMVEEGRDCTIEELPPLMDLEPIEESKPIAEPEPVSELEPMPEPVAEELPPMPDLSDPNKMMSPDDIAALLANMSAESSVVAEEAAEPEPIAEPEPEPAVEELPPMPDLSDPNKIMSPDEIEALLASMAADTANAASLPDVEIVEEEEPELEPIPEPVAEELPPMPDLSDPNRQMSPDEIAALFANLG